MSSRDLSLTFVLTLALLGTASCGDETLASEAPSELGAAPTEPHEEDDATADTLAFQVPANDSCTATQRRALTEPKRLARTLAARAVALWTDNEGRDWRGTRWFGTELGRLERAQVLSMLTATHDYLANASYTIECTTAGSCQKPGVIAYVQIQPRLESVFLCPRFWELPVDGFNSQMDTLIHEFSHLVGSQDIVYGLDKCLALATSNPKVTYLNADSIAYYVADRGAQVGTPIPPFSEVLIR